MVSWMEYFVWRLFRILRRLRIQGVLRLVTPTRMFTDYFRGFEKVDAVKGIFGEKTKEILGSLKVEFIFFGYMGVDGADGHLMVNERYLNKGDKEDIYLDVIHELVHVRQWLEGKELFDPRYDYVDRPTEIEAYAYTVNEARKLGWTDERICQYLKTEWMNDRELKRLANSINVKYG